jgi:hypothetical protein
VLILGWLLLGIAFLAAEAGILSLNAPSGQYVSIVGALKVDLLGASKVPYSKWPWSPVSAGSIASSAGSDLLGLESQLNPINAAEDVFGG